MVKKAPKQEASKEEEDPLNRINTVRLKRGKVAKFVEQEIPWHAYSNEPFDKKEEGNGQQQPSYEKIHPILKKWIAERDKNDKELLMINFYDDLKIPRFPGPNIKESRKSSVNKKAVRYGEKLVKEITNRRDASYKKTTEEITNEYDCRVLETFWLIKAMLVEIPLTNISRLIEREDVMYVEPQNAGEEPPSDTNPNNDVDDGRGRIVSDPYFNLGLRGGWIGLLDTGLRFTHTQFNSPSNIAFRRDCVNGGADCNTGTGLNPNDDCWNHGTSSAAIISGNANQGNAFRGVTAITLDSFKVYPTSFDPNGSCNGGLDEAAAVRGFQAAVAALDRVIVAEMQGGGDYVSSISTAADNAFDAGAVIIAANGNNGPGSDTVNAPASAHKVIGVGNFDVQTLTQINSQSRGPTPDKRYKPDVQAPTNTETASNASDTAFRSFGGTSGATPYAAGAAALLRNWLRGTSFTLDPGQVYAHLILSGQQPYPFNNTSGAGPLRLPTDGWVWWGKVSVSNGATINIPLNIAEGTYNVFDGALWWPERGPIRIGWFTIELHNDVDLHLIDPTGVVRDVSDSIDSVFERAQVLGHIAPGTWTLRIRGYNVPFGSQVVYWAAAAMRR